MRKLRRRDSERLLDNALRNFLESQERGEVESDSPSRLLLSDMVGKVERLSPGLVVKSDDRSVWRVEGGEIVRDDVLSFESQVEQEVTGQVEDGEADDAEEIEHIGL